MLSFAKNSGAIMITSFFTYSKPKVIQALRYHFISRKEIKIMMILVNVFAIVSAALFYFKEISPFAFLVSSILWFFLMILFWFVLPNMVYKQAKTFRDRFKAYLSDTAFTIENDRSSRSWEWTEFSSWTESPYFFHLYFNPRSFFLIPKEAFEGDDEHEARKVFQVKIKG
jgi:hypothetical protein